MLRLVCECALTDCENAIDVPASVFEQARDAGPHYIVSPGHQLPDIERAIDRGDGWIVVEKIGTARRGAAEESA